MRYTLDFSLFSVLIPVYNMEKYIGKCIYSVLEQTYPDFEVILIDDGSTDDSGKICDRYAKLDERIKVYHQTRQGLYKVRRKAIEKASGDYFLFLDGNDYWECDLLETISRTIWNYNCDLVIFNYQNLTTEGVIKNKPVFEDGSLFDIYNKSRIFEEILNGNQLNKLCTFAVKNNIVHCADKSKVKNFKEGRDFVYILPFIYKANRILYLDKPMYNFRMIPKRISYKFYINRINDDIKVYKLLLRYMELLNMKDKKHLQNFYQNYMKCILEYLSELSNSKINFIRKRKILNKIYKIPLYQSASKYLDKSSLSTSEKILLYLLNEKRYNLIILNERKNRIVHCILHRNIK